MALNLSDGGGLQVFNNVQATDRFWGARAPHGAGDDGRYDAEVMRAYFQSGGSGGYEYTFSNSTAPTNPGNGGLKYNSGTDTAITAVYVSSVTNTGILVDELFSNAKVGTTFLIREEAQSDRSQVFRLIDPPVDNTGWWTLPVEWVSSGSRGLPRNNQTVTFGQSGSAKSSIAPFISNFDSATGASDPGSETFRFNSITASAITQMYINDTLAISGADFGGVLAELDADVVLQIAQETDLGNHVILKLIGPPIDNGGWWTIQVSYVSGVVLPTAGAECQIAIVGGGGAGGGGGGHTIQDEGTPLTQRANLNFVGAGVTATDDVGNNATVVTIPGGGGGGGFAKRIDMQVDENLRDLATGGNVVNQGSVALVAGIIGQAYEFTDDTNKRLIVPVVLGRTTFGARDWSLCVWINPAVGALAGTHTIVARDKFTTGRRAGLFFTSGPNTRFTIGNGEAAIFDAAGTTTLSENVWQHLAVAYDHSARQMTFYVNGIAETPQIVTGIEPGEDFDDLEFFIGVRKSNDSSAFDIPFDGLIEQPFMVNYVLSAGDISAVYNGGSGTADLPTALGLV